MSLQSVAGFALLGCSMILVRAQQRFAVRLADFLMLCTCLTVLTIVSGHFVSCIRLFGIPAIIPTSPQTLLCLTLLTTIVLIRRTRMAFSPSLQGVDWVAGWPGCCRPFCWLCRSCARGSGLGFSAPGNAAHYVTAMLASTAAIVSMLLLLYLAWRINGMESRNACS